MIQGRDIFGMLFCSVFAVMVAQAEPLKKMTEPSEIASTLPEIKDSLTKKNLVLGVIDGEAEKSLSVVTIRLSDKPNWESVSMEDHGTFLQIVLPGTLVPKPGEFFDGNSPYVTKIAAFQISAKDAAVRIFVNKDAAKVKAAASAEILNDRILVSIDHTSLEKMLAEIPQTTFEATAEDVVARTKVFKDIPPPADLLKLAPPAVAAGELVKTSEGATGLAGSLQKSMPSILKGKLEEMTIFSIILLVGLCGFYIARPFLRKGVKAGAGEAFVMKTLSTLQLSPKQKISLVQVGNERLLLAIAPDGITLLSHIGAGNVSRDPFSGGKGTSGFSTKGSTEPLFRQVMTPSPTVARQPVANPDRHPTLTSSLQARVQYQKQVAAPVSEEPTTNDDYDDAYLPKPVRQEARKKPRSAVSAESENNRNFERQLSDQNDNESSDALGDVTRLIKARLRNLPAV